MQATFLGLVQGLTEFLPVSSSGHLVVFQKILGVSEHSIAFDVAAHLGTLASILTVYRVFLVKTIKETFARPFDLRDESRQLVRMVVIASVPTGIIGLLFKETFEGLFSNLLAVGICFAVTGLVLLVSDTKTNQQGPVDFLHFSLSDLRPLTWTIAFFIGLAQSVAIAPGISRSGITIASGLLLGLPQKLAALFSFMISIPAILGAAALQLKDFGDFDQQMASSLALGFVVAYVSGVLGLKLVLHYVRRGRLSLFSYYLWIASALTVGWSYWA